MMTLKGLWQTKRTVTKKMIRIRTNLPKIINLIKRLVNLIITLMMTKTLKKILIFQKLSTMAKKIIRIKK